tara:strand:+ start:1359 stop:2078 length:720 start_codon:yes stop_codon:yes gene_type:complete
MKYILPFLLAASLHADDTDGIKTREEIFESKSQTEYFIINDIISEKTIYVPLKKADEYFLKSLNYYNRNLSTVTKKAIEKATKEKKMVFVNIVAGDNIPAHAFRGSKPTYKVDDVTNGQWTIFKIGPDGHIDKDHYTAGQYGQVGRDGVSYEHAVKVFGGIKIRNAVERAKESDKNNDWYVTIKFPDSPISFEQFDNFVDYEEWWQRTRYRPENYTVEKIKRERKLVNFGEAIELSDNK